MLQIYIKNSNTRFEKNTLLSVMVFMSVYIVHCTLYIVHCTLYIVHQLQLINTKYKIKMISLSIDQQKTHNRGQ